MVMHTTTPTHPAIASFTQVLGAKNIATGDRNTEHYRTGWRSGGGSALAVLFPQDLVSYWQCLEICVAHNCIIIMQAANTGLTEGSTPSGDDYDRDIVVINTLAMDQLLVLDEGNQVVSFPGATLHKLETTLKPYNRAPHSVIGSSCLGASIVGGIANNSGGALVKRGPAYTELALFARVDDEGKLELVNHLGLDLGETPEQILTNLEQGHYTITEGSADIAASARDYEQRIRDVTADSPSRYNADETRLFEASGCAGKVAIFAVRLDTFAVPDQEQTFYIGTNNPKVLSQLRRRILTECSVLPDVGEYIHRDVFDVAKEYGKDTFLSVKHIGTQHLPRAFAIKGRIDASLNKLPLLPKYLTDRMLQIGSKLLPSHLPDRMLRFRACYEHHLILKMSDQGINEAREILADVFAQSNADKEQGVNNVQGVNKEQGDYFECSPEEAQSAYLHRFAAAGAAIRYQTMHSSKVGDILALDIALRCNEQDWVERLPASISEQIEKSLYYGHFFCHVFHQDYILKKGADAKAVKQTMLEVLDRRGAKYPAEHNVGHLYEAEPVLQAFYRSLDPTNTFNPGIGKMDKYKRNCGCC